MADFKIKISTPADTSGAKETAKSLGAVEEAAKRSKRTHDEHTGAVEKSGAAHKNLINQLKALRHEVPGVGSVLHVVRHPITLAAVAVGYLVGKLKEFGEEVEAASKRMEAFGHGAISIRGMAKVIADTATERKKFIRDLEAIGQKAEDAREMIGRLQQQQSHRAELASRVAGAQVGAQKAAIDLAVDRGEISPEQAEVRKAAIDRGRAFAEREGELGILRGEVGATARAEISERDRLRIATGALPGAQAAEKGAAAALNTARNLAEAHAADVKAPHEAEERRKAFLRGVLMVPGFLNIPHPAFFGFPASISREEAAAELADIESRAGEPARMAEQAAGVAATREGEHGIAADRLREVEAAMSGSKASLGDLAREKAVRMGRLSDTMAAFRSISAIEGNPPPGMGGPLIATPRENIMANAAISMRGGTRATGARLFESEKNEIVAALQEVLREMAGEIRQSKSREARDLPFTWR